MVCILKPKLAHLPRTTMYHGTFYWFHQQQLITCTPFEIMEKNKIATCNKCRRICKSSDKLIKLSCGHTICNTCIEKNLLDQMHQKEFNISFQCTLKNCQTLIDEQQMAQILPNTPKLLQCLIKRYMQYDLLITQQQHNYNQWSPSRIPQQNRVDSKRQLNAKSMSSQFESVFNKSGAIFDLDKQNTGAANMNIVNYNTALNASGSIHNLPAAGLGSSTGFIFGGSQHLIGGNYNVSNVNISPVVSSDEWESEATPQRDSNDNKETLLGNGKGARGSEIKDHDDKKASGQECKEKYFAIAVVYLKDVLHKREPQRNICDGQTRLFGIEYLTPFSIYQIIKSRFWKCMIFLMLWINMLKAFWEPPNDGDNAVPVVSHVEWIDFL